jgi:hypothetical protein
MGGGNLGEDFHGEFQEQEWPEH